MAKKGKKKVLKKEAGFGKGEGQAQPAKQVKQGSTDDFDIVYQTPPPLVKEVKPSRISRFFSYIMDSKVGKILFGSALSRTITILFTTAVLSGIFPPAIPFAVTAAIISLTAVGVGAIVDTVRTRSVRKLAEESDLLVRNRDALSKQEYMLKNLGPELSDILKDQLYRPNPPQQKNNNYYVGTGKTANLGQIVLDTAPAAANFVLHSMLAASTGNPMAIVKALNSGTITAATLIGGGAGAKYMVDISKALKLHINEERQYTEPYKDIAQLRTNVEKQEIQTLTLQKLLQDPDYFKFTPQEKRERFIALQEKLVKSKNLTEELQKHRAHPIAKQSDSILSDIGRAHNPFYVQPTRKPDSELTKAIASESAKEKAKKSAQEIISPAVKDLVLPKSVDRASQQQLSPQELGQQLLDQSSRLVSPEDLSNLKKKASYLDLAETHSQKVKAQPKGNPVKAKAQDR